jgi:hypothetical protein
VARAAIGSRVPARLQRVADQRDLRADRRHALPRLPVADLVVPGRIRLLTDVPRCAWKPHAGDISQALGPLGFWHPVGPHIVAPWTRRGHRAQVTDVDLRNPR